jgi:hypothetical protein
MRSRSGELLQRLMQGGEIDAVDIRRELCLDDADFAQLVAGTRTMSLPHQLSFATLLVERVPRLARAGRTLRDQVEAAIAYTSGATTTHSSHPMRWSGLKARRD